MKEAVEYDAAKIFMGKDAEKKGNLSRRENSIKAPYEILSKWRCPLSACGVTYASANAMRFEWI